MSKRNSVNKNNNNKINNNNTNNNNNQLNSNYNVIINQNSTFNQDNSINIMLDSSFPYFQNYNYQTNANETDKSSQIYQYYQPINSQGNKTNSQIKANTNNTNSKNNSIQKKKEG